MANKFPDFLPLFGQIVILMATKNSEKQLLGIILQANGLMENFLGDESILNDIEELTKEEASVELEFLVTYESLVSMVLQNLLPLMKVEKLKSSSSKEAIKDFLALFQLVVAKVRYHKTSIKM